MTPITPEWLRKIADEVEADPSRWTKNAFARDANKEFEDYGRPVPPDSPDAVCWCAQGFAMRDGVDGFDGFDGDFYSFYVDVATNDSLNSPAEFVAWLREMAKELEVQS